MSFVLTGFSVVKELCLFLAVTFKYLRVFSFGKKKKKKLQSSYHKKKSTKSYASAPFPVQL